MWYSSDNEVFMLGEVASYQTLPPGIYSTKKTIIDTIFTRKEFSTENLIPLEDTPNQKVLQDIESFWNSEDRFKKFSFPYKRGILLYGAPGTGKSTTLAQVSQKIVERQGYVLLFRNSEDFLGGVEALRETQPHSPIVAIMEDLDQILMDDDPSYILELLDGAYEAIQNVVYLATTNYPESLQDNILNRPSRFDRRIEFTPPSAKARKQYLETLLRSGEEKPEIPLEVNLDVDFWVQNTEGLSVAHLKELFLSVVCFDQDFDKVKKELENVSCLPE